VQTLDGNRFDALLRSFTECPTRRGIGQTLAGFAFGGMFTKLSLIEAEAKKKRKKKKRKKKCKNGTKKCGKQCCASGDACLEGKCCPADRVCAAACCAGGDVCIDDACCPADRACGTICCAGSQICGDPEQAVCVVGQGTCAAGASSCSSANFIFCNASDQCVCAQAIDGSTRCTTPIATNGVDDCGQCTSDNDCEILFPAIVGVFCAENATGPCGCQPGENLCSAPCTVV
jgi:hypothetical protein